MTLPVTIAAARKIERLPEKIDDTRIWGGLQPPRTTGSYAYEHSDLRDLWYRTGP